MGGQGLSEGLAPTMKGKGLMGKSVEQIMKTLRIVRNRPIPAVVITSGLMDKTVKVAVQRWALVWLCLGNILF